jgi:hypothetical protein
MHLIAVLLQAVARNMQGPLKIRQHAERFLFLLDPL